MLAIACGTEHKNTTITRVVEYQLIHDTLYVESGPKATGIGGVFFKSKNPAALKQWYSEHLGFTTDQYGTNFISRSVSDPYTRTFTQWSPFVESTQYFAPSEKEFMINYRVKDLESLLGELRTGGVEIVDNMEVYEYGKFVHIMDLEGNKIELWEPINDSLYQTYCEGATY